MLLYVFLLKQEFLNADKIYKNRLQEMSPQHASQCCLPDYLESIHFFSLVLAFKKNSLPSERVKCHTPKSISLSGFNFPKLIKFLHEGNSSALHCASLMHRVLRVIGARYT